MMSHYQLNSRKININLIPLIFLWCKLKSKKAIFSQHIILIRLLEKLLFILIFIIIEISLKISKNMPKLIKLMFMKKPEKKSFKILLIKLKSKVNLEWLKFCLEGMENCNYLLILIWNLIIKTQLQQQ